MVVMGQIVAPYGIKGWIKVRAFTGRLDALLDYPSWWVGKEGDWRECEVLEAHVQGKTVVAEIEGCSSRNESERMKGVQIAVPRDMLPAAGENEYYWNDLIGLEVFNLEGEKFGKVESILETGANDVLVVKNGNEHLIPFIGQYVHEVDLENKRVLVDWKADY